MRASLLLALSWTLLLYLAGTGCPAGSYASDDDDSADDRWDGDDDDYPPYDDDDDDAGDDDSSPPETEDDFVSVAPAAADVVVFIANPNRDTVSKVFVQTRDITTIEVGDEPTQVEVTADYSRAVVFNDGEDSVSVIDVDTDDVRTVSVREDFNFMVISPTGSHAVCYLNLALMEDEELDGILSFNEISIVDLETMESEDFSTSFNPRQVKFSEDGLRAAIISDEFIAVVDLDAEEVEPDMIDLEADPFDPPTAAEVELEPTGEFAYIRYHDLDALQVVDLDNGELLWLSAGDEPTDMDLSPDGTQVMVVSRGSRELRTFQATAPASAPRVMELPGTETIGSLAMAPLGDVAMLYTTAELTDRVTLWDRGSDQLTIKRLEKPVKQVIMAPDGRSVLVVHTLQDASGEYDIYTDRYLITVATVDDGTFVPNAVMLEDELVSLANFDDGLRAIFMMEDTRHVGIIHYPSRLVDDLQMPSYPVHVGVMPEHPALPEPVAWVSQDHPLGRISFIDAGDLGIHTVTGFELNAGD